jgi:hypothetical protein
VQTDLAPCNPIAQENEVIWRHRGLLLGLHIHSDSECQLKRQNFVNIGESEARIEQKETLGQIG